MINKMRVLDMLTTIMRKTRASGVMEQVINDIQDITNDYIKEIKNQGESNVPETKR